MERVPPRDRPTRPVPDSPAARTSALPPAVPAAVAGALAAGVAMAAAELLAGVMSGAPSLVVAIGTLVIDLQPPGAKDFVVGLFGTNDKLALNVFVVVVALLLAAWTGIVARRRFSSGIAVFVVFGLVAAFAAAREPQIALPFAIVSAALAVGAGLFSLRRLLDLVPGPGGSTVGSGVRSSSASASGTRDRAAAPVWTAPVELADESAPEPAPVRSSPKRPNRPALAAMPDWDRRRFLIASAGTLGAAVVAGGLGRLLLDAQHPGGVVTSTKLPAALLPVQPLTATESIAVPGITPLVVPNEDFYRIDTALLVPRVDVSSWQLKVTGMVDHPLTFTYDQLLAMPLFEQYVTIACVSNVVGGHLVGNSLWTGVKLRDVLASAGVQAGATQIVGRSVDGFTVGFPTSWAMAPEREPMIAVGMNREPLPAEHGFPARLIVPGLFGYVSATKWLSEIQLTTREAVDGYWVPLGWAKDGPILTQSRIDVPQDGASVPAGTVSLAGVAWAPDRGIARVEVKIDQGPWQQAQISQPISKATWVQWVYPWQASKGQHTVEVRATDDTGEVQTDQISPPDPDGARGHDVISVSVG